MCLRPCEPEPTVGSCRHVPLELEASRFLRFQGAALELLSGKCSGEDNNIGSSKQVCMQHFGAARGINSSSITQWMHSPRNSTGDVAKAMHMVLRCMHTDRWAKCRTT
jgi:hypothetical protein